MCYFIPKNSFFLKETVPDQHTSEILTSGISSTIISLFNSIIVEYIETENSILHYGSTKEINKVAKTIPMQRMGKPKDIANACIFFSSDLAGWITGAALEVHGGGEKPSYLDVAKPQ